MAKQNIIIKLIGCMWLAIWAIIGLILLGLLGNIILNPSIIFESTNAGLNLYLELGTKIILGSSMIGLLIILGYLILKLILSLGFNIELQE